MAVTDWPYNYATTNTTLSFTPSITVGSSSVPYIVTSGGAGGGGWTAPAPRDPTALEWLDAEVEKVCKLARLAG
jgi:hypothetical protein